MAKNPDKSGKQDPRSARPATGATTPRYDDRPETARGGSGATAGENPSIPRYGDDEPGDPRRAHSEAALGDEDAELSEDELDMTGDEDDEEEEI